MNPTNLQGSANLINSFLGKYVGNNFFLVYLIKLALVVTIICGLNIFFRILLQFVFTLYKDTEKYPTVSALEQSSISHSLAQFTALISGKVVLISFFSNDSPGINILSRILSFITVLTVAAMAFRALKSLEFYYGIKRDIHKIMALSAISQTVKIFGILIFSIIGLCVIFGISGSLILGSLGAITAVLVLVFRDTILGFVTGLHVATSKSLKVGDWIGIPKYNLEGTILKIELLTTRIQSFDKTISTIPTYDLLSTEVKNLQVMSETNTKRIKTSIILSVKSFKFLSEETYEELLSIDLVKEYLTEKKGRIKGKVKKETLLPENPINDSPITNIEVYRYYVLRYLSQNPYVDSKGTIMVRELEMTSQGIPIEIYCFATTSNIEVYEQIKADIMDHLIVSSGYFGLEIMQL
ncbi:MAG: mechanosensitive ion channel [Bergeyella sp.]|nr:mechanosensitive ion channel [Bergeyella sp.]